MNILMDPAVAATGTALAREPVVQDPDTTSAKAKKLEASGPEGGALGGETATVPVKRGRGRPRKNPLATATVGGDSESPVVKRGRGRPKKTPATPEGQALAQGESPAIKRGRGRPKKTASSPNGSVSNGAEPQEKCAASGTADAANSTPISTSTQDTPKKRGRGRPKKGEEKPPSDSPAPKKRRGRPPKTADASKPSSKKIKTVYSAEEPTVMGKLQISFSESESEGPDSMEAQRLNIDALTDIVAPATASDPVPPHNDSALLVDNKFEESFDED